jgi:glycosyltransferase involved in cell wall biosynthesis
LRIAVVNNFFPPRVGGSSHLSDALARGYAARGHDVLVVTAAYGDAPAEEHRDGLRIVRMPSWTIPETRLSVAFDISFASRPSLPRRLRALLDGFGPDVLHQHGQFFDLTWATGGWARRRGVPALLSVHTRLENPQARYAQVFRLLDALLVRPALRRFQPRIVVMDKLMDRYIRRRYAGAYAGLAYIPVGVDGSTTQRDGRSIRDRHGLNAGPVILSLGHVIPLRDRVTLVEAMPEILAVHPEAVLLVVGRVYYDVFLRKAAELGVDHAVRSVGPVPKSEVGRYLGLAAVECHESGIGLGTASLEAMAAGVPVVAPVDADNFPGIDLTGCLRMVPSGDPAALAAAINSILSDPADAARVGRAGQALVREHFSLESVLDRHLAVLEDLARSARPGRRPGAAAGSSGARRRHPRVPRSRRGTAPTGSSAAPRS